MNLLLTIKYPVQEELAAFKQLFDSALLSSNPLLEEALTHIRQRGGKMMRPILIFLIARNFGEVTASTLNAAVSLELLHTASLVHDDVVDESTQRRGQLSVNAIFNNKVAVLVGDFLLATSLVHATKTNIVAIINVISTLGQELAEGELLQLSNVSNPDFSEQVYFDVIRKKTAALFAACTEVAALSVGVSGKGRKLARLLGEYIGICFQIKDDIFDYFDNNEELGKPTGNDMLEGKLTLPVLYVLKTATEEWPKRLAAKVKSGEASQKEIDRLVEFTKLNGGIEYAEQVMHWYKDSALELLKDIPDMEIRESLISYLSYVVNREK